MRSSALPSGNSSPQSQLSVGAQGLQSSHVALESLISLTGRRAAGRQQRSCRRPPPKVTVFAHSQNMRLRGKMKEEEKKSHTRTEDASQRSGAGRSSSTACPTAQHSAIKAISHTRNSQISISPFASQALRLPSRFQILQKNKGLKISFGASSRWLWGTTVPQRAAEAELSPAEAVEPLGGGWGTTQTASSPPSAADFTKQSVAPQPCRINASKGPLWRRVLSRCPTPACTQGMLKPTPPNHQWI